MSELAVEGSVFDSFSESSSREGSARAGSYYYKASPRAGLLSRAAPDYDKNAAGAGLPSA